MIIYPVRTFIRENDEYVFYQEKITYFTSLKEAVRFADRKSGDLLPLAIVHEKYDEQEYELTLAKKKRARALAKLTSEEKQLLGL